MRYTLLAAFLTGRQTQNPTRLPRNTGRDGAVHLEKEGPVLPEKQDKTFGEFYKAARYNDILDQKTSLMIHLATAMSAACYP